MRALIYDPMRKDRVSMLSMAVGLVLWCCQTALPAELSPRPSIPRVGIPRGEVPIDVGPVPKGEG